jgi:hypothetical protein
MKNMRSQEDGYVSHLSMKFQTADEVWSFWMNYGGRNGFGARKGFDHESTKDDVITSKVFSTDVKV